jgi:hypothetical protein
MRIINRKEFLELPSGTLFCKYNECCFGDMSIKYDTWKESNDFLYVDINDFIYGDSSDSTFDKLEQMKNTGENVSIDLDVQSRDGLYEDGQLFAVYDNNDVLHIIEKLKACLK